MSKSVISFSIALLLCGVCSFAQQRITLHEKAQPIENLIIKAIDQAGLRPGFSSEIFKDCPLMEANFNSVKIEEFFLSLFAGLNYRMDISSGTVIISREPDFRAPLYKNLYGRVLDNKNEPVKDAEIEAIGGSAHVRTTADGSFSLPVTGYFTRVRIRCFGFTTQQLVLCNRTRHESDIQLIPEAINLNEVVTIGYGKTTERLSTGGVYTMKGEDIIKQPVTNVMSALQGQIPSLFVRRPNGVLGSSFSVTSRGEKSITQGNEPLVIVDGVPMPSRNFIGIIGPGSSLGVGGASSLNGIPLDHIASISVLNGADAAAIYGSRGSNGVILITLKKGETGKLHLTADVSWGQVRTMKTSPLLNTQQFLAYKSEAVTNDGLAVDTNTVQELRWGTSRSRNLRRLVSGNAGSPLNARVDILGGGNENSFLLSGSLHRQAAVFPGQTEDNRQSLYGYWHGASAEQRLQLTVSGMYSFQRERLPLEDLSAYSVGAPNTPEFYTPAHQPVWSDRGLYFTNIQALTNNTYQLGMYNLLGHIQAGYKLKPWLSLETSLGVYRVGAEEKGITTQAGQNPLFADSGRVNLTNNDFTSKIVEVTANLSRKVKWGLFEAVLGGSWQGEERDSLMVNVHYPTDSLLNAGNGGVAASLETGKSSYDYRSLFGRGKYVIANRYILSISGRLDGSSRYGGARQFGRFVSAGGAWIFSQEPFFKGFEGISYGKLRANFGTTGNDQILTLGGSNLHWELNYNEELGLDLGFLKDRLIFSMVGYRVWSDNQVLKEGPGRPTYSNQPVRVLNEGLELVLRGRMGHDGGLQWASQLNLTIPRNRLDRYPDIQNSAYATNYVVGKPLNVSKGFHLLGVDADSGIYRFQDVNKDGRYTTKDYLISPSTDPRCYGGWSNTLTYQQWQLDIVGIFFIQNGDNPLIALDRLNVPGMAIPGFSQPDNGPVEWMDHWRKPGDHSSRQRLTYKAGTPAAIALDRYLSSDANVIDASYARLKTVSLSWKMPERWLSKCHFKAMQGYIRAQDLFTLTKYPVTDPETQNPLVLPPSRIWVIGATISI